MTPPPLDGPDLPPPAPPPAPPRPGVLAPLRHPGFRLQWPADLAVSWAFEMETIILGWYVLTETGSVVWLTVFAALPFLGTLLSPWYGMMGDRIGHRRVLAAMRAAYAAMAALLTLLVVLDRLDPVLVIALATLIGLVRPSDIGMRNALIGAAVPPALLMGAIGLGRTGMDAARVAGALTGAGLVALIGMGPAYAVVTALYLVSFALMLRIPDPPARAAPAGAKASARRELVEGLAYAWTTPALLAALFLAFLANMLAYPLSGGLLPYVAREVYGIDRTGLGYLVASFAAGGLVGSLLLSMAGGTRIRPARAMILAALVWFALLLVFANAATPVAGMALLALAGFVQSFCMVPMAVLLLRVAGDRYRGRVMGLRMLAVYGLPVGLLAAGPLIEGWGFAAAATGYAALGLACALAAAIGWWRHLWPREAAGNARLG